MLSEKSNENSAEVLRKSTPLNRVVFRTTCQGVI